jgi:hypothetical protein
MALRKFLFMDQDYGFAQEGNPTTDSIELGGLIMHNDIDMNGNQLSTLGPATASGQALAFGQPGAELGDLTINSGGDIVLSGGGEVTGLPATPGSDTAAASKSYVDAVAQGLDVHPSVRLATTAAGTLATDFEPGDLVDGKALVVGNRILIKNQADPIENGIYIVQASGAPLRATDLKVGDEAAGSFVFVEDGDTLADNGYVCTANAPADVVGTNELPFSQFSGAGQVVAGDGLKKTGNRLDVELSTNSGLTFVGTDPAKTLGLSTTGDAVAR